MISNTNNVAQNNDGLWYMVQGWVDEMHHTKMHQSAYARHRSIDRSRLSKLLKMRDLPQEATEYIKKQNPSERSVFAALKCDSNDIEGIMGCLKKTSKRSIKPVKSRLERKSTPVKEKPMDTVQIPTAFNFEKLSNEIKSIKTAMEVAASNESRVEGLESSIQSLLSRVEQVEKESVERHQEILKALSNPPQVKTDLKQEEPVKTSFKDYLKGLKPSKVIQSVFLTLMSVAMAGVTIVQTQPIYEAVGLGGEWLIPVVATVLAALAALNFSIKKSWFSFLLCVGVCSYELALVSLGTSVDDQAVHSQKILQNPEVEALKENLNSTKLDYTNAKQKYLNPESKVFENQWYKTKFVDPSLQTYLQAKDSYTQKVEVLTQGFNSMASHLKIAFRLGLIVGLMLLVHAAADSGREGLKFG